MPFENHQQFCQLGIGWRKTLSQTNDEAACVAVIVAEPVPTGVTVLPKIVATPLLLIEWLNAPPLDADGYIVFCKHE